jgi:HTH-type transcriptional regulator/antitoxin HigA
MNNMMQVNVMERSEKFIFSKDQDILDKMISSIESAGELYERENLPDPIEYLKEIMAQRGLRNMDLKAVIGSSGNISAILNRRKPLSLRMIRNLNRHLNIPAKILIQPYDCRKL